ncbi:sodium:calcium antiporter [Desulfuribacillus alkaliarsenatis]|uniref:Cation transporter n=1 Tax=Desulfuribacillus alkaliarsenatis TaxID=766136 RepID=A0A1E5G4F2_9FIRM|nr:sodium:calcium antiporter [Desulfuribacillus alkaliarsenatis]OEF97977.1 cation transporter [Desulfuribacillus alkaliarsenatis]
MIFVLFFIASIVTIVAAVKVSKYADVISEKTSFGGLMIGTVLLAGATSLPEITTSASAIAINNPDIAIGNVLGSNIFNVLIIAVLDIWFRRKKMFLFASSEHRITATIGTLMMVTVIIGIMSGTSYEIFGIGLTSYLLIVIYIVGMWLISAINRKVRGSILKETIEKTSMELNVEKAVEINTTTVKQAVMGFVGFAFIILLAGSSLSILGDQIAVITGLGSTFVGSFLIAATTSLPEVVSVYAALRLSNVNLAIGAVLGSNIFNMLIITFSDSLYRPGSILSAIDPVQAVTAFGGLVMSLLILMTLFYRKAKSTWAYSMPPAVMMIAYLIVTYVIFTS